MISRQWRGLAKPAQADRYVEYLRQETFPHLAGIPGFVSATVLKRELGNGVEFVVVTQWQSMAPIQQFAGKNADAAVVPQKVRDLMIEYDEKVRLYEVVETLGGR